MRGKCSRSVDGWPTLFLKSKQQLPFSRRSTQTASTFNETQVERYLADRAAKGLTARIANLVEPRFNAPLNQFGEHPFRNPQAVSTPNERYFEFADWVVQAQ